MIDELACKIMQPDMILDEELEFMMENIGHENPRIRDDLIYGLFCIGFEKELFSKEQVESMIKYLFDHNILLKDIETKAIHSTLVRSYGALLWSLILFYDNENIRFFYRRKEKRFFR
ncbi:hypothetical protein EII25_02055 [Erysipelotrichaceae bacterium OH741_COT-311]|nr:hypothetical protein EII25_02055 [Erysipelotrichaceae bacterium OH741_COT-311]